MVRRRAQRKSRLQKKASAKGEDPDDPITASLIVAGIGAAGTVGAAAISKSKRPKPIKAKPRRSLTSPTDTGLKAGQRSNLINTSPQGLLESPSTGRQTLLGG